MRTAGLMMNDVWAHRALRESGVETIRSDEQPAEIGVLVESVTISHHGPETRYRPYLHLTGELTRVKLPQALPYGIDEVFYDSAHSEKVDAFYEFDDEQLVDLTAKGYFNPEFIVPDGVTSLEWVLPATIDAMVLAPQGPEESPVVFVNVHDIGNLEIDLQNSGYDVAHYFSDYSKNGISRDEHEVVVDERGLRARADAINSLFKDEQEAGLETGTQTAPGTEVGQVEVPETETTTLAAQIAAAEAELAAEREGYLDELRSQEGTPENLYAQKVAPALKPEVEPELAQPAGKTEKSFEERKAEISRRAADINFDAELDEDTLGR